MKCSIRHRLHARAVTLIVVMLISTSSAEAQAPPTKDATSNSIGMAPTLPPGFRNRVAVMFQWIYSYFSFKRSARIIAYPPATPPEKGAPKAVQG